MSETRKICGGGAGECCGSCRHFVGRLPNAEPITEHMCWIKPEPLDGGGCGSWHGTESRISDWRGE